MNKSIIFSILMLPALVWGQTPTASTSVASTDPKNPLTVKLFWNYDAIPKEMQVFELKTDAKKKLWDTGVVKEAGELPTGDKISNDTLFLHPGQNKKFVLVFKNTTNKTINFFAAPHQMKPEGNALGYKFKCLCINRVYEVQPGAYWYRVVELRVSPQVSGNYLEITHSLFGVTVEKTKGLKYQPMGNMDMDHEM